jgi:hypothetical protein
MTKTVEDAALLLNHLTGYDSHDVASVEHAKEDYVESMRQPVSGIRLGIPRAPFFDALDDETANAVQAAIGVLTKLTKSTVDCSLPGTAGFDALALGGERVAYHHELFRRNSARYSLAVRQSLESALKAMNDPSTEPCSEKIVDYVTSNWKLILLRKNIDAYEESSVLLEKYDVEFAAGINDARTAKGGRATQAKLFQTACLQHSIARDLALWLFEDWALIGLMIAGPRFSEGRWLPMNAYEGDAVARRDNAKPGWSLSGHGNHDSAIFPAIVQLPSPTSRAAGASARICHQNGANRRKISTTSRPWAEPDSASAPASANVRSARISRTADLPITSSTSSRRCLHRKCSSGSSLRVIAGPSPHDSPCLAVRSSAEREPPRRPTRGTARSLDRP